MLPKKFRTFLVLCQDNQSLALIALALLLDKSTLLSTLDHQKGPNYQKLECEIVHRLQLEEGKEDSIRPKELICAVKCSKLIIYILIKNLKNLFWPNHSLKIPHTGDTDSLDVCV